MTTRERVEQRLKHNQFQLHYKGGGHWEISGLTGTPLGFAIDYWPFLVVIF